MGGEHFHDDEGPLLVFGMCCKQGSVPRGTTELGILKQPDRKAGE